MPRKKTSRIILISTAAFVATLLTVIALIPAMVNRGLGHGAIRNAIEAQINGTADFQQIRITWFGPQAMTGLQLFDEDGREAALLNVSISEGLLPLLFGPSSIHANLSGTAHGELYEDGTVSFQRLIAQRERDDEPLNMHGVPAIQLTVNTLTVFMHDRVGGHELAFENLSGDAVYQPGNTLAFAMTGTTNADGTRGSLAAMGNAPGLFDHAGNFTPDDTPVEVTLAITSIPIPGVDIRSMLHNLVLEVHSENLIEGVTVSTRGDGTIQGEQPSRFSGEFRVRNPIRPDGTFDLAMERITGGLSGERVPTSLLQPAFNGTPVILSRDVGRTVDIHLELNSEPDGTTFITAVGQRATVELSAHQEDDWWVGERLVLITPQAHPALVEGYTGLTIEQPTDVSINLSAFAIPPYDEALDGRPWGFASATGSLQIIGPVIVLMPGDNEANAPARFTLADATIDLNAAPLGEVVYLTGTAILDGGSVTLNHGVGNLADASGRIDAANALPIGELTIQNLPSSTIAQFMPDLADTLQELLGQSITASVFTDAVDDGLRAIVAASGRAAQANLTAVRMSDALRLTEGRVELALTPSLTTAMLQNWMDEPVQLLQDATASLELVPTEFPGSAPFDYQFTDVPITAQLMATNLAFDRVPGLAEPIGANSVSATIDFAMDEQWSIAADGRANLRRHAANRRFSQLTYNLTASPRIDQPMQLDGTFGMETIRVEDVEALLGQEPGRVTNWVGTDGSLQGRLATITDGYDLTLTSNLQRLTGTFSSTLINQRMTLNSDDAAINLAATALQHMLDPEGMTALQISSDVPMAMRVQSRFPLAMFQDQPYDPEEVDFNASLTGGPLELISEGEPTTLSNMVIAVRSEAVNGGVDFIINVDADISERIETARRGGIDLSGRVRQPLSDQPTLDMQGTLTAAPSILADAMLNMNGYLVSAIGREVDLSLHSQNFSRNSGTLSVDIDAAHGWMRAAGAGSDGMLMFAEGSPIEGELSLTPLLRDRLLASFNPLLGAILAMPQPMQFRISNATLPMDGDISRFNADVQLDIGEVDIDPQTPLFSMLRMARGPNVGRLDGFIDPIYAQIRNGVINYDRFNITMDRLTIPYQGSINLVEGSVNLRTVLPLGELLVAGIREIPDEARMIDVPLVTRGSFADLDTTIDPQFDLSRALIEAGVRRGLDELIPRDRLPFDLRDLLPR